MNCDNDRFLAFLFPLGYFYGIFAALGEETGKKKHSITCAVPACEQMSDNRRQGLPINLLPRQMEAEICQKHMS